MSYIRTGLGEVSDAQISTLLDIDPEDLKKLDADRRIELAIQHADYKARKTEAFWTALATALPLLALLGITRIWK